MTNSSSLHQSLFQRKETKRNMRKALFYSFLTAFLLAGFLIFGIPVLIRLAALIGDIKSSTLPVDYAEVPPPPPQLQPLPEATNSAQIAVSGFTKPGISVEVYLGSALIKKVVSEKDGFFIADNIGLNEGRNEIVAKTVNSKNISSQESEMYVVIYDRTPPSLEVINPSQIELTVNNPNIYIKGFVEENTKVVINNQQAIVKTDGSFEKLQNLNPGENLIKVTAVDQAGNQTEKELKITYSP